MGPGAAGAGKSPGASGLHVPCPGKGMLSLPVLLLALLLVLPSHYGTPSAQAAGLDSFATTVTAKATSARPLNCSGQLPEWVSAYAAWHASKRGQPDAK